MKKSIYLLLLVCTVSMLALAGRNSDKCENRNEYKVKESVVIEKEKGSMPDLLSPLHLLVFSL